MAEIESHSRTYHRTSNDIRQRIVAAYEAGNDDATIASCFQVNSWTVRRIIDKYTRTGKTNKEQHGGYKQRLLTDAHCEYLKELMEEDASVTLERMQEQLWAVSGLSISKTAIHRTIIRFDPRRRTKKARVRAAAVRKRAQTVLSEV